MAHVGHLAGGALPSCNSHVNLSLVHMHNIHPVCKFAPGVYFGHVNGAL